MSLPTKLPWEQAQNQWASVLNPIVSNPTNNISILRNIPIAIGANTINHKLGQMMQGWFLVDVDGGASIYRSQPFNNLTLTLTSDAAVTVSIGVF